MAKSNKKNQSQRKDSSTETEGDSLSAIDLFYSQHLGDRWQRLKEILLIDGGKKELLVERWNRFSKDPQPNERFSTIVSSKPIERDSAGLLKSYIMDPASIFAAEALNVSAGDFVLDMCAAPGGKSLILAERIGPTGELMANEVSEGRRERLKKVIQQYIPFEQRQNIWVTGKDGGLFAKSHLEYFDKILVDAPCSGERYLLNSPQELLEWSPQWSARLAQRQYALLTAALLALKPGGVCVYSTCSASPLENDEVIRKLIKKKKEQFLVVENELPHEKAERTEFGIQLWPDQSEMGPIYYCKIQKS